MGDNWRLFETIQMAMFLVGVGVVAYSPIARAERMLAQARDRGLLNAPKDA